MLIAITRPVSPSLAKCELTHLAREPIDVARATSQHAAYEHLLGSLGATIVRAPAAPQFPDAVFIEDTAIVLDEVAVLTRPGAPSRQGESAAVAPVLAKYRSLLSMEPPATLDGGDVLRLGRTLYVGRSGRTNQEGIEELQRLVERFDYRVVPVEFTGCQALAVGRGFKQAAVESGYVIYACSVMPEHVHLVIAKHPRDIRRIMAHLRAF